MNASPALTDLVVLDLSQDVAGPYCAKLFADFGAMVIKLEPPGTGDRARTLAPLKDAAPVGEASGVFAYLNANKRSATLDVETPSGAELLRRLVSGADIVIESHPPGHLDGLGLGHRDLRAINADLVVTSVTWYGQTGPYSLFEGNDGLVHSLAGVVQVMGTPEGPPLLPSGYQAQLVGGTTAFIGTMGALHGRLAGQGGRHVDQSIFEAAMCFTEPGAVAAYPAPLRFPRVGINRFVPTFPCGIYPCEGGWIGITALTPSQWKAFCVLIELPELDDPAYATALHRVFAADTLEAAFMPRLLERSAADWLVRGQDARIPFAPVPSMAELLRTPHLVERGAFARVTHPDLGAIDVPAPPFRLLRTPARQGGPVPRLGEHGQAIYRERLGMGDAEYARLRAQDVV